MSGLADCGLGAGGNASGQEQKVEGEVGGDESQSRLQKRTDRWGKPAGLAFRVACSLLAMKFLPSTKLNTDTCCDMLLGTLQVGAAMAIIFACLKFLAPPLDKWRMITSHRH